MPLIKQTLESQIKIAAKEAYIKAAKKGMSLKEPSIDNIADEFANAFSAKLATAIDSYIKTATVIVNVVTPTGPGTGTGMIS